MVAKGRIGSAPDHHPTRGYSPAQSTDCTAQPDDRNGPQELLSRFSAPIQQRSNTPQNRITHAPSMACPTVNRTLYAVTHCPYAKSIAKHPLKSLTRVLRNDRSQDPMSQPANCLSQPTVSASQLSQPANCLSQPTVSASQLSQPANCLSQPTVSASQLSQPANCLSQPTVSASQLSQPAKSGRQNTMVPRRDCS